MESESLYELWETLVNYIPGKDKIEAGEMFIKQCDDLGMSSEDIEILIDGNPILLVSLDRYFEDEEDEYYEEVPKCLTNKEKCFWPIGPYEIKNTDYLKNSNNFLIQQPDGDNYECASLSDMKRTAKSKESDGLKRKYYKGFFECSKAIMDEVRKSGAVPLGFGSGDFNDTV